MAPMRAAIYLRQSKDESGDRLAVERQLDQCREILRQRGWTLHAVYEDNDLSASDRRKCRPRYDAMTADYDAGAFGAIVCYDLDRLTRQPRQLEDWIDRATERGLVLVTANGEADLSTDGGRLFARMKAAVARSEIERKSRRQKDANLQKVQRGVPQQGIRAIGYTLDGKVVPHEAEQVRRFFDGFLAGDSLRSLAASATVPPRRSERWSPNSVRGVLENARYAGLYVFRGEVQEGVEAKWEPIVSEASFRAVQAVLSDPRRKRRHGTERKYLGSSLFLCGECGSTVRSGNYGYRCCYSRSGPIDRFVTRAVAARLDLAGLKPSGDDGTAAAAAAVTACRERLRAIEGDYDAGLIDGVRYRAARGRVEAELADAQNRLKASRDPLAMLRGSASAGEAFLALPLMVQQAVVREVAVVTLLRVPKGRKGFDPSTVRIEWLA